MTEIKGASRELASFAHAQILNQSESSFKVLRKSFSKFMKDSDA
jgi:hypothetical protein